MQGKHYMDISVLIEHTYYTSKPVQNENVQLSLAVSMDITVPSDFSYRYYPHVFFIFIGLGLSIRPSVRYACTQLRTVRDRILLFVCGRSMKIKRTYFFLSRGLVVAELYPFSTFFLQFSHCKPMEGCEQNILRTI